MSTNKNVSTESMGENFAEKRSVVEDIDDHSEFDVSETKENKIKSGDNSPVVTTTTTSPIHPTTRSETSFNVTLSESGRVKRKCVIESEKRRLYTSDLGSPLYMPMEEEITQKTPRMKGRRGRPPKLGPDGYPVSKKFADYKRPDVFYQSSPYDGFTYTFSTALANLSCKFVSDGYFRNIVDHHKTINFPRNIFAQDIVANHLSHQKPLRNNGNPIGRIPAHMFNQPGPHMYRSTMPPMATHIPQQQPFYHNIMPNVQRPNNAQQPQLQQRPNNIAVVGNYPEYTSNMYPINGNNNQRPPTPSQLQHHQHQNSITPQNVYTSSAQYTAMPRTQHVVNNHTSNDINHMSNTQCINPATSSHIRTNVNNNSSNSENTNTTGGGSIWIPKSFHSSYSPSFNVGNEKQTLNNLSAINSVTTHQNHYNMGIHNNNNNTENNNDGSMHRNDQITQLSKMELPDPILHSSNSTNAPTASVIFAPDKDL